MRDQVNRGSHPPPGALIDEGAGTAQTGEQAVGTVPGTEGFGAVLRGRARPGRLVFAVAMVVGLLVVSLGSVADAVPPATSPWGLLDPGLPGVLTALNGASVQVEQGGSGRAVLHVRGAPGAASLTVRLAALPEERFFGLGERFGSFDLRGQLLANWSADGMGRPGVATTYAPMPYLISERGYALHLDTTASAMFDLAPPGCGRTPLRCRPRGSRSTPCGSTT